VEDEELAAALGIDLDELEEIKKLSSISFISFEEVGYSETQDKGRLLKLLVDGKGDALAVTEFRQLRDALARAIEQLPEKEKLVLSLYYYEELNMKETGAVLNITESRVSQIHSQAILRLRSRLRKDRVLEN
jgi:RNA polymerase sigma factor for flagellar operon FliA